MRSLFNFWAFVAHFVVCGVVLAQDSRPNILLILADDLAWSDLGCYGHPWHETPNLDRLAGQGMRFTDAYAPAPICSASRASILTGKTTARLNFEFVTKDKPGHQKIEGKVKMRTPAFTLDLPLEEETIAEVLGPAGFDTCFAGKWHVSKHHGGYLGWSPTHGPAQQGFATTINTFGSHTYAWRDKEVAKITEKGVFPSDALTDQAADFVRKKRDKPFFLMVSHYFVHTPVDTNCRWLVEKYEKLVPGDSPNREKRIRYGAFVEMLDHYVGQLLAAVDEAGLGKETLVVFTSDNGGHPEFAANGPLRGSKWNLYEGGIRVPFIVRWPGVVKAGAVSSEPVIGYDLLPTFADIAEVEERSEMDGISILPAFRGETLSEDRPLVWHFPYYHPEKGYKGAIDAIGIDDFAVSKTRPQSAIRIGAHKLLHFHESDVIEVYDLSNDRGEKENVFGKHKKTFPLADRLIESLRGMNARMPETFSKEQ